MKKIRRQVGSSLTGYLFVLPSFALMVVFLIHPIIEALRLSFYDSTLKKHEFVGFQNYVQLMKDDLFILSLINTFKYVIIIVPSVVFLSLFISAVIYRQKPLVTSIFRGIFYIPTIVSAVTVSVIWGWILNPVIGIANYTLTSIGGDAIMWFSSRKTALYCVAFVSIICAIGQPIILYTAALGGVSKDYYEASSIDGASAFTQFWRITIPLLKPTTLYVLVIATVNAFQIFIPVQLLTGGGPVNSTTSLIFQLYRTAFQYNNFGYASAMGIVLFIILGVLAAFQFKLMSSDK